MTVGDCLEKRLLRRERPDALKAKKSLETAKLKLTEASELAEAGFPRVALVTAYSSMFHSARALLFRDGFVEKSHYCLVEFVRENYAKKGLVEPGLVTVFDALRQERQDVMYGFGEAKVKAKNAEFAIENARKFAKAVEKLLGG